MRRSTLTAAVVAFVALAGLVLGPGSRTDERGYRLHFVRTDIANLARAVELYGQDKGDFPTEAQGLAMLVSSSPSFLNKLPHDPWGAPYLYHRTASKPGFEIHSAGRNGRDEGGVGDDITLADKAYRCEDYQVNCGLTADIVWPLVLVAAFLASVATLLLTGIRFLIDRFRTKVD